jgi:hypothetical protein
VIHTTTLLLHPFKHGSFSWRPRKATPFGPIELTLDEKNELLEWCDLVHKADDKGARIAVQRTVRALAERDDAMDSFIDAIVAFESLFGARQQIALSLAACAARLLDIDKDMRKVTYSRVKKLYDRRSDILHGTSVPRLAETIECRDEALKYLIESLRKLYRERPQLLAMTGSEREIELLLEA